MGHFVWILSKLSVWEYFQMNGSPAHPRDHTSTVYVTGFQNCKTHPSPSHQVTSKSQNIPDILIQDVYKEISWKGKFIVHLRTGLI